jgi:hypothetical protein
VLPLSCYRYISAIIYKHWIFQKWILNSNWWIITRISYLDQPAESVHLFVISPLPYLHMNRPTTAIKPSINMMFVIFRSVLVVGSLLSMVYSLSAGNLIRSRLTNKYHLMLQWFICYEMWCRQFHSTTTSRYMHSHIRDQLITHNWNFGVLSTKWTCRIEHLFRPHLLGLRWNGLMIRMSYVARNTLHSIYGKTTQSQNTVYLAPIKRSQIKGSVICRNH